MRLANGEIDYEKIFAKVTDYLKDDSSSYDLKYYSEGRLKNSEEFINFLKQLDYEDGFSTDQQYVTNSSKDPGGFKFFLSQRLITSEIDSDVFGETCSTMMTPMRQEGLQEREIVRH